jgi:GT2 family glycosyltransferase
MRGAELDASCGIVCGAAPLAQLEHLLLSLAICRPRLAVYLAGAAKRPELAALAERYGAYHVAVPPRLGHAHAHNRMLHAALAAGSRYHFLFAPDIALPLDAVAKLLAWIEQHPDVGLVAPRIRHPDGRLQPLCSLLPNPLDWLVRRCLPLLYRSSGRLTRFQLAESGYCRVLDVPVPSGCCLLMRVDAVRAAGFFDERFLLDFGTVDLARRIAQHARCVFVPHVGIVRDPASASERGGRARWRRLVSALRYFNKWGWVRDAERVRVNARTLRALGAVRRSPAGTYRGSMLTEGKDWPG